MVENILLIADLIAKAEIDLPVDEQTKIDKAWFEIKKAALRNETN
jgi:hypothetical protein